MGEWSYKDTYYSIYVDQQVLRSFHYVCMYSTKLYTIAATDK